MLSSFHAYICWFFFRANHSHTHALRMCISYTHTRKYFSAFMQSFQFEVLSLIFLSHISISSHPLYFFILYEIKYLISILNSLFEVMRMDFVDITANLCNPQLHHFSPRSIHLCIFWLILNIHGQWMMIDITMMRMDINWKKCCALMINSTAKFDCE